MKAFCLCLFLIACSLSSLEEVGVETFSPFMNSSVVIPKISQRGKILLNSGVLWSVSHLEIVCLVTPIFFS